MQQHQPYLSYISLRQKIAALICGLPLAASVLLPGCLPQKDMRPGKTAQQPTTGIGTLAAAIEVGLETVFDPKLHIAGQVFIDQASGNVDAEKIVANLKAQGIEVQVQQLSKHIHLITFDKDPRTTQAVYDQLRGNTPVYFDVLNQPENVYTTVFNDQRNNNYDSDRFQVVDVLPDRSSDIDSLYAFTPPSLKNNENDPGENVEIVFNELPHLNLRNGTSTFPPHFAPIDSTQSINLVTGDKNFSTPTHSHGNHVRAPISITNDGRALAGISNVKRPVITNVAQVSGSQYGYTTSLQLAQNDYLIEQAEKNPHKRFIQSKSHGTTGNATTHGPRFEKMNQLGNIIVVSAAGNSGISNPTGAREVFQNYDFYLSVGSTGNMLNNAKSSISNRGEWLDVYMQGESVRGIGDNGTQSQQSGTSFASPRVAASVQALASFPGMQTHYTAKQVVAAIQNLNRTQVIQPDGTRKPLMHLWDLVSNMYINDMHTKMPQISKVDNPTLDLKQFTNPTGGCTWMKEVKYYIKNEGADDNTYVEVANGVLNTTAQTAGKKVIKIDFENDHGGGPGGANTRSMVLRFVNIVSTAVVTYTFTGSGLYNNPANWAGGILPPNPLPAGSTIIINGSGECILNVPQTIAAGATLNVANGARFRIMGNLIRQ